jgi:uncharacterized repeat protein (TIGR01451 family)/LPXTG-motif cell wall-anchored protein
MKKRTMLANAGVSGAVLAVLTVVPAMACYPQGSIIKEVEDNTTSSKLVDANTSADALAVNQGDTLTYSITIANAEATEGNGQADMTNVMLTDALPAGVQLVSDPSTTTITENLGTIKAKGSVTKTYQVKVTATTDGQVITNKACYTSSSNIGATYDQAGCDTAVVKVSVPTPTPTPTPIPTPTPTPTPTTPASTTPTTPTTTSLPNTGAGNVAIVAVGAVVLAYAANILRLRRRATATERA